MPCSPPLPCWLSLGLGVSDPAWCPCSVHLGPLLPLPPVPYPFSLGWLLLIRKVLVTVSPPWGDFPEHPVQRHPITVIPSFMKLFSAVSFDPVCRIIFVVCLDSVCSTRPPRVVFVFPWVSEAWPRAWHRFQTHLVGERSINLCSDPGLPEGRGLPLFSA